MDEGPEGCCADYKQADAEHVCNQAKTKAARGQ